MASKAAKPRSGYIDSFLLPKLRELKLRAQINNFNYIANLIPIYQDNLSNISRDNAFQRVKDAFKDQYRCAINIQPVI